MRRTMESLIFGFLLSMGVAACTTASTLDIRNTNTAKSETTPQPEKRTVPSGTYMTVELQDGISTEKSSPGDSFSGNLSKDVIVDGLTVFEKGSAVHGRVVDVQEPGPVKGRAQLKLELTSVEHNGREVPIQTQMYVGIGHHHSKKPDPEEIGSGTAIRTAIGAISGGPTPLHYPPETRLLFTLASPVEI